MEIAVDIAELIERANLHAKSLAIISGTQATIGAKEAAKTSLVSAIKCVSEVENGKERASILGIIAAKAEDFDIAADLVYEAFEQYGSTQPETLVGSLVTSGFTKIELLLRLAIPCAYNAIAATWCAAVAEARPLLLQDLAELVRGIKHDNQV